MIPQAQYTTDPLLQRQLESQVSDALPAAMTGHRSILLLRTVSTPGSAAVKPHQPAAPQNLVWRRELRREVERQHQAAARPVTGRVPPNKNALWFKNDEEALACLWMWSSQTRQNLPWWGRSLLKYWGVHGTLVTAWLAQLPRLVPHSLVLLSHWGTALSALASLSSENARSLLTGLLREWQVDWKPTTSDFGNFDDPGRIDHAGSIFTRSNTQPPFYDSRDNNLILSFPLTPAHTSLWFLCSSLADHPHRVSKNQLDAIWSGIGPFTNEFPLERTQKGEAMGDANGDVWTKLGEGHAQTFHTTPAETGHPLTSLRNLLPGYSRKPDLVVGSKPDSIPNVESSERPLHTHDFVQADSKRVQAIFQQPKRTPSSTARIQTFSSKPPNSSSSDLLTPLVGISTRLGGLFYLINLMDQLELPTCFEDSCALQSAVGPWEVLEGLGRALLAETGRRFTDDPVWRVLAELAGRSADDPPGLRLDRFDDLDIPANWPADSGSAVAVKPFSGLASAPLTEFLPQPFSYWLTAVGPLIGQWLTARLSRFEELPAGWDYVNFFAHPATVLVTRTHLDVKLPLESISTPARLVGLDLNPGWQPAWGRVITFYFEANFRGNR